MNHLMIEYIIFPEGREFLLVGQRVYQRTRGEDWEPIDPDILNTITLTRDASVQGILIEGVNQ